MYSQQTEGRHWAGMEGVKDLHRPCACYGITQCVIRVDILITNMLIYFVQNIGVFFKLIDRYNERMSFVLYVHEALRIDEIC